ncbi:MAG: acyl-CoA dehydrogenase family protein, partial [Anaerolineae bacterium]
GILAEPGTYGGAGTEGVLVAATMIAQGVYASAERVTNRTMELMAAAGYARESQLERYWRDVKTVQGCLGAVEMAKHQYARWFYQCESF